MYNISEEIKKIACHLGYDEQSSQLIEECTELIQAINKHRRVKVAGNKHKVQMALENIAEEIADVEIMLEQIKYLLNIPEEELQVTKVYKVNRTKELLLGCKGE